MEQVKANKITVKAGAVVEFVKTVLKGDITIGWLLAYCCCLSAP